MKTQIYRSIAVALLALFFAQSALATCGGGGGGGGGGMASGGGGGAATHPFTSCRGKFAKRMIRRQRVSCSIGFRND
jgi:hypothetical protein